MGRALRVSLRATNVVKQGAEVTDELTYCGHGKAYDVDCSECETVWGHSFMTDKVEEHLWIPRAMLEAREK